MQTHAVIFDRDNTLLYFDQSVITAMQGRIAAVAPNLPFQQTMEAWRSWPGPWPRSVADEPVFWQRFWAVVAEPYGLLEEQLMRLCAISAMYYTCFAVFADAVGCIQALKAAGFRLALLTNFELPSIDRTLEYAGIAPSLFDVSVSSSMLVAPKPDPRSFCAVAEMLGESLEHCAVIDDMPEHVAAARALGMRAIQIDRIGGTHDISRDLICSLEALPDILLSVYSPTPRAVS